MEYQRLFSELWRHEVRYLLCGGLAVNIYGIPRMTADIDLLIDFHETNVDLFLKTLQDLSYHPAIPLPFKSLCNVNERIRLKDEKNLIAYSFNNRQAGYLSLDVLLSSPLTFEYLWNHRNIRHGNGYEINVVSIDDLIELKKYAGRAQDNDDIVLLNKYRRHE